MEGAGCNQGNVTAHLKKLADRGEIMRKQDPKSKSTKFLYKTK